MSHNIFILSAPIQSGKTTALMEFWEGGVTSFDGFITPEIDESRKLILLDTDEELPFELADGDESNSISIGRFKFSKSTFELVKKKLKTLDKTAANLIIVDELGKLEMEGNGFEPELGEFIQNFKLKAKNKLLILVIRNTLLAAAIEKYELEEASVLSLDLFIEKFLES
jgi:nucleoside-triphosphatase THEP1